MVLEAMTEVLQEMQRQIKLYGVQHLPSGTGFVGAEESLNWARNTFEKALNSGLLTWRDVLEEEVHEVYAAKTPEEIREELIQVAAVALSWVRDIDQSQGGL